jgi:predicted Zn-dependent protease
MTGLAMRLVMAAVVSIISLLSYCSSKEYNPVTGENQYISLTARQEIALGLQAVPQMMKQYGGLYPKQKYQEFVDRVGFRLVQSSRAKDTPWQFEFHLLNDPKTINAFALPGGQIFITTGLYTLFSSEDQLAAVLSHEIAHVVARHSSQRIAKASLTKGIADAVMVASGDARAGQISAIVGQMVSMKFSREDEIEADRLGVFFMTESGYDPRGMVQLMELLQSTGRGNRPPEFFSTHPSPENRIEKIQEAIRESLGRKEG